jgi:amidase
MDRRHRGIHYARARNLAFKLRAAYDDALAKVDLLLMPTLPMRATVLPPPTAPLDEYLGRALEMLNNTAPFDVTGHPAISVPCGGSGLPIGMMLVGKRWDDVTVLRGAKLFETLVGGFPMPKAA